MLFWALQCGGWAVFGAVMLSWGLEFWAWPQALLNKSLLALVGFVLTLGFREVYRRLRRHGGVALVLAIGALSSGGAPVWRQIHGLLLAFAGGARLVWTPLALGTVVFDSLVLLAWSLLYTGIVTWMELQQEKDRARRAEELAREARLRALQFQLEPHFLFNTLNAISTLVVEGHSAQASRMISRLSDFLRLTLESAETPEISVARELDFARGYLEIQQARFGARLTAAIHAGADVMDGLVPALIVQPLLENAVKHGVLERDGGGSVTLAVTRAGERLRIDVTNDGPGPDASGASRNGIGLANTAARLDELYGSAASLRLAARDGAGTSAAIEIPFRTAAAGSAP